MRFRWLVWYWKIMSCQQLYMDILFAVQIKLLCTLLDAFIGISAMRLCVCFFKKMGSPNTSNVSALLGEWNLETPQCGGLLGFPGWANVGVPATPASWSCHHQLIMRVPDSAAHSSARITFRRFYSNIHLHPQISSPFGSQFPHPNLTPSKCLGEVFGVTFSFHSSLPCLWAIIGGHFCFIFTTLRGSKASEKPGGFDVDAVGNGGQYHFSGTFWYNLAALAGGMGEIIMKNRVESNGTSWNVMHVLEFPLLKTQTCTLFLIKKQNQTTIHSTSFSSLHTSFIIPNLPPLNSFSNPISTKWRRFQAFLPPLGCILAFAVFPTANSLAATAAPTQMATAQGLISGSRTLAEGVSPVLFGGGKSGGDGTWKKWQKWNKYLYTIFYHHFAIMLSCVVMWKDPT